MKKLYICVCVCSFVRSIVRSVVYSSMPLYTVCKNESYVLFKEGLCLYVTTHALALNLNIVYDETNYTSHLRVLSI